MTRKLCIDISILQSTKVHHIKMSSLFKTSSIKTSLSFIYSSHANIDYIILQLYMNSIIIIIGNSKRLHCINSAKIPRFDWDTCLLIPLLNDVL